MDNSEQCGGSERHGINPWQCPLCGQPMVVEQRLGVPIDVCPNHGIWLEKGKLEELLWEFSRPERIRAEAAEKEVKRWKEWPRGLA